MNLGCFTCMHPDSQKLLILLYIVILTILRYQLTILKYHMWHFSKHMP